MDPNIFAPLLPALLLVVPLVLGIIDFTSIGRVQPASQRF